ncbi:MAG: serine/threonine-protein kinase [Planctomycetota bacterium]
MIDATKMSPRPLVDRYLRERRRNQSIAIEDVLPEGTDDQSEILRALVEVDIQARIADGESVSPRDYLSRWPDMPKEWLVDAQLCGIQNESTEPISQRSVRRVESSIQTGDRIDHYVIGQPIGRGTHGQVFLAEDMELHRTIALKVSPDLGIEGRILAQLKHPNIVDVYRQFVIGRHRFLAMQLVDGPTLASVLAAKPFREPRRWSRNQLIDWIKRQCRHSNTDQGESTLRAQEDVSYERVVVDLVFGIAKALHHAHLRGVLHRDIKPSNVMLDVSGTPMLMDFNVAALDTAAEQSLFGGTLAYMSPEHLTAFEVDSKADSVDARSDVYAMGVMFMELLTGDRTWSDESSLLVQRSAGPSTEVLESIPWTLRPIVAKCLRPDPRDRYQSVSELIADLSAWREGGSLIHSRHVGWTRSFVHALRVHRKVAGIAAITCGLLIGLVIIANLRTRAIVLRSQTLTDRAAANLEQHLLSEAIESIGEAKGIIASSPGVQLIQLHRVEQLERRWRRLGASVQSIQLRQQLNAFRTSQVSAPRSSMGADFARDSLAEFGLLDRDDWETSPPYTQLDDAQQSQVAEQITELILLVSLQRNQMDDSQRETLARVLRRTPEIHRDGWAFGLLEDGGQIIPKVMDEFQSYLVGIVRFSERDFENARRRFADSRRQRPIGADPRYWCCFWEAYSCQELQRFAEAATLYGACIGQHADFPWPYANLALMHAQLGEWQLAKSYANQAIRVRPDFGQAHETRAAVSLELGDYSSAIESIQAAERSGYWSERLDDCRDRCQR